MGTGGLGIEPTSKRVFAAAARLASRLYARHREYRSIKEVRGADSRACRGALRRRGEEVRQSLQMTPREGCSRVLLWREVEPHPLQNHLPGLRI
jgi:hypothetical protein